MVVATVLLFSFFFNFFFLGSLCRMQNNCVRWRKEIVFVKPKKISIIIIIIIIII